MSKAKDRPPRLEPHVSAAGIARPATIEERLERAKVAGRAGAPGPQEMRHLVERVAAGEPAAIAGVAAGAAPTVADVWAAIAQVYGALPHDVAIEPGRTVDAARWAAGRVADVAAAGKRIAFATAAPASMLPLVLALARNARDAGAEIVDEDDGRPARIDGRTARFVRWLDGVAVVSDGSNVWSTNGPEAPREWLFLTPRAALVVADGPFAEAAYAAGAEVIAFMGLDRLSLAVPAARRDRCVVVPVTPGRPARSYRPVLELFEAAFASRGTGSSKFKM